MTYSLILSLKVYSSYSLNFKGTS